MSLETDHSAQDGQPSRAPRRTQRPQGRALYLSSLTEHQSGSPIRPPTESSWPRTSRSGRAHCRPPIPRRNGICCRPRYVCSRRHDRTGMRCGPNNVDAAVRGRACRARCIEERRARHGGTRRRVGSGHTSCVVIVASYGVRQMDRAAGSRSAKGEASCGSRGRSPRCGSARREAH